MIAIVIQCGKEWGWLGQVTMKGRWKGIGDGNSSVPLPGETEGYAITHCSPALYGSRTQIKALSESEISSMEAWLSHFHGNGTAAKVTKGSRTNKQHTELCHEAYNSRLPLRSQILTRNPHYICSNQSLQPAWKSCMKQIHSPSMNSKSLLGTKGLLWSAFSLLSSHGIQRCSPTRKVCHAMCAHPSWDLMMKNYLAIMAALLLPVRRDCHDSWACLDLAACSRQAPKTPHASHRVCHEFCLKHVVIWCFKFIDFYAHSCSSSAMPCGCLWFI